MNITVYVLQEIAEEVRISTVSCHTVLTEKLKMDHIYTKCMLHLLTDKQIRNFVDIIQEPLDLASVNVNFLT